MTTRVREPELTPSLAAMVSASNFTPAGLVWLKWPLPVPVAEWTRESIGLAMAGAGL